MATSSGHATAIRSSMDAESVACDWMRANGFPDARLTSIGPDGGIDVVAAGAVAQVKAQAKPVGVAVVQRTAGAAILGSKVALVFGQDGFTDAARRFARDAGVALLTFDRAGAVEPHNRVARDLASTSAGRLRRRYESMMEAGHLDEAGDAAYELGQMFDESGETEEAVAAYKLAIGTGARYPAAWAAYMLGSIRYVEGDFVRARAAYEHALDFGERSVTAWADLGLADVFNAIDAFDEAEGAYRKALDIPGSHSDFARERFAEMNARKAEADQRQAEEREELDQLAAACDSGDIADAVAMGSMIALRRATEREDEPGAFEICHMLIERYGVDAGEAALTLGRLYRCRGDVEEAECWFRTAVEGRDSFASDTARLLLVALLEEQGRLDEAGTVFRHLSSRGADIVYQGSTRALFYDNEGTKAVLRVLVERGNDCARAAAAFELAEALRRYRCGPWPDDEVEEAEEIVDLYRVACQADDERLAQRAANELGGMFDSLDRPDKSRDAYKHAMAGPDRFLRTAAEMMLGFLLVDVGDHEGALSAFQSVLASPEVDDRAEVEIQVGHAYRALGRLDEAAVAYRRSCQDDHFGVEASYYLGHVLAERGDVVGARAAYQIAAQSEWYFASEARALAQGLL